MLSLQYVTYTLERTHLYAVREKDVWPSLLFDEEASWLRALFGLRLLLRSRGNASTGTAGRACDKDSSWHSHHSRLAWEEPLTSSSVKCRMTFVAFLTRFQR